LKVHRYNLFEGSRPNLSEFLHRALTVANVKVIADDHTRRF
jgi:hypothetical protein